MTATLRQDVTIDEWVEALESGRYSRTMGSLGRRRSDGTISHCGLGVLLDLAGAEWAERGRLSGILLCTQIHHTSSVPHRYRHLLGEMGHLLDRRAVSSTGSRMDVHDVLTAANDASRQGFVPVIKALRRLQEWDDCGSLLVRDDRGEKVCPGPVER